MRRAAAIYGLFVVLLFAPFLLEGRVFVPGDFLSFIYPWRAYSSAFPHNIELFDVSVFFFPQDVFYNTSLKAGGLPLWNPHIFSGHPIVASGQSGFLYPPRVLLHYLLSPAVAKTWIQLSHVFAMALAMFCFLRVRGFHFHPSLLGGLVWMGNSYALSWMEFEHVAIAGVYLPLLALSLEKALSGGRRWWCALPILGALSLHSGHLQINLYTGLIFAVYALLRTWQVGSRHHWWKLLGVGVITVGLAGPTVFPFLSFLSESQRAPLNIQDNAASFLSIVLSLFNPDLFGNPARGFMLNRCAANLIYPEFACFVGTVPLILSLTAKGREARILQVTSLLCIVFASASFSLTLPFLDRFVPGRVLHILVFCLTILATMGAQQLRDSERRVRFASLVVGAVWVIILGGIGYLLFHPALVLEWCSHHPEKVKLPPANMGPEKIWSSFHATYAWNLQLFLPLLGVGFLAFKPTKHWLLVAVTITEFWLFGSTFNTTVAPDSLLNVTPEIATMQKAEGRVVSVGCANYNTLTPYGLSLVNGYESLISQGYSAALSQAEPERTLPMRSLALKRLDLPMIDALSVEYALFAPHQELDAAGWGLVMAGDGGNVYQNFDFVPRCTLLGEVRVLRHLAELQSFAPRREAFVSLAPPADLAPSSGRVVWLIDRPDELELSVTTETTQLLLLTDAYDPGWKCEVDGVEVPVFAANLTSRGIYLPKGTHTVRFEFKPTPYRWGKVAAAVSGLLLLLWLGLAGKSDGAEGPSVISQEPSEHD